MATFDVSRSGTDYRKQYTDVRMQQGRVLMDEDWNENERLHAERERRSLVDIVGHTGTPDQGFRILQPTANAAKEIDFTAQKGTYYLGGYRVQIAESETYRLQKDWLQMVDSENPKVLKDGQCDLVYLEVWQQGVVAAEDSELLEPALGGPDTSARVRTMHRLRVKTDVGTSQCRAAWQTLQDAWTAAKAGTLGSDHGLVQDMTMSVGFAPGSDPEDLCNPPIAGGYLGAENQALRVQLTDADHFTWGYDNAAPLYRVELAADQGHWKIVKFKTEPKDQAHWPLAGQIVEILPWSAVLPNNEKLSVTRGFLARVESSYTADSRQLTLIQPVPQHYGEAWKQRTDAASLGTPFFYLRVWNRGTDTDSARAIPFTPGTPVSLGHTGLSVTFQGTQRVAGTYWVIAARPETPNEVLPWRLKEGMAPHGFKRYYAPLAVIAWNISGNTVTGKVVSDCRDAFRPLTQLRNCCTWFVGDGISSHGDFNKIQDAIDSLPAQGGEIFILPGRYSEAVRVEGRKGVTLRGCGKKSVIQPPAGSQFGLCIEDSSDITVRELAVKTEDAFGVVLRESVEHWRASLLRKIVLEELEISVRDCCAVMNRGGDQVTLRHCRILTDCFDKTVIENKQLGKAPAVFMGGNDAVLESNEILTRVCAARLHTALGGIQIGGGSDRVRIQGNRISGGNGNGITLGSIVYVGKKELQNLNKEKGNADYLRILMGWEGMNAWGFVLPDAGGCIHVVPEPEAPLDEDGSPKKPRSEGNLTEVTIQENVIEDMGMNGLATLHLPSQALRIGVRGLRVEANRIRKCLQITLGNGADAVLDYWIQGGVVLGQVSDAAFYDNRIENNGTTFLEPVCGIGVLEGEAVDLRGNRITENGPRVPTTQNPKPGIRGGIVLVHVQTPYQTTEDTQNASKAAERAGAKKRAAGESETLEGTLSKDPKIPGFEVTFNLPLHLTANFAARIQDNIVMAPEGRALQVTASGSVVVEGNQLVSTGNYHANVQVAWQTLLQDVAHKTDDKKGKALKTSQDALNILGGAAVAIVNLGYPLDFKSTMVTQGLTHIWPKKVQSQPVKKSKASASTTITTEGGMKALNGMINLFAGTPKNMHRFLSGGQVMFNNNQVQLQLWEEGRTQALSGVLLLSLDDIGMVGNQCDCKHMRDDAVIVHTLAAGFSVRVTANRFREGLGKSSLSALTAGVLNHTVDNQGTYCFLAVGPKSLVPCVPNRSLIQLFHNSVCQFESIAHFLAKVFPTFGVYPSTSNCGPVLNHEAGTTLDNVFSELGRLGCDLNGAQWITKLGGVYGVMTQMWILNVEESVAGVGVELENLANERQRAVQKYGVNSAKVKLMEAELNRVKAKEKEMKEELANLAKVFK